MAEHQLQRRHLDALVAVSRIGSVHAAARSLGMPQPQLSRHIAEAEQILAVKLFTRSSKGSTVTRQGRPIVAQAEVALRALERVHPASAEELPVVQLGCIPRAMHTLMPRVLARMRRDAARFRLRVTEGASLPLIGALERGALDFAIALEEARLSGEAFAADRLYVERTVVICAADHRGIPRKGVELASLAGLPWVLPLPETHSRRIFDHAIQASGLPPVAPLIEARSFESNLSLVASAQCVSIAPESVARSNQRFGVIRIVRLRTPLPASPVSLIYRHATTQDAALHAFRALVLATAAEARAAFSWS